MSPSREQSIKFDNGKIRLELLPPKALMAMGAVLTYGAEKYEAESWRKVEADRYEGALLRHLVAYMSGETNDPESTMPHLWHVLCNAAFLVELAEKEEPNVLATPVLSGVAPSQEEISDCIRSQVTSPVYSVGQGPQIGPDSKFVFGCMGTQAGDCI